MDQENTCNQSYERYKRRNSQKIVDLLLRAYSVMGILIFILGLGYFLLTLLPFKLTFQQQIALMAAGVGIVLALMSRTLILFRKEQYSEELNHLKENASLATFLSAWNQFEHASKTALTKEGENFNRHSLRAIIARLHDEGKISREDVLLLDEALQTRNSIVHGEQKPSQGVTEAITKTLLEIISKISIHI